MKKAELKAFLDEKAAEYEHPTFLEADPIQLPHEFSQKEDIEIAGFLIALIAWGNRKSILKSGRLLLDLLDNSPYDFVLNHREADLHALEQFVHRTFQGKDLPFMIGVLKELYTQVGGLEGFFSKERIPQDKKDITSPLQVRISELKSYFFSWPHQARTRKHLADPVAGSAAKRINMYLRWMVRPSDKGVDFGLWKNIHPKELSCPLDVHTANIARKLKILKRKQNDAKAVAELDRALRRFDPEDPVKYDFALFGLGAYEQF
jgi:uncharacterized protein (TIGR02757 family)